MLNYEISFLLALVLTVSVETSLLYWLLRRFYTSQKFSQGLIIFAGVFASFATLPYVWFIFPAFIHVRWLHTIVSEVSVTLIEAVFYSCVFRIGYRRALYLSLACNAASFVFGLALFPRLIKLVF